MHKSRQIALLDPENVHGVACLYEANRYGSRGEELSKPVVFKTLRDDFKVGDYVLVETETRHQVTVVKVEQLDVEIDLESADWLRWIVSGPFDLKERDALLAQEAAILDRIKAAQNRKRTEKLRADLTGDLTAEELDQLQIGPPKKT